MTLRISIIILLLAGCQKNESLPEQLLPEPVYIDLLTEMVLIQTYQSAHFDSARTASYTDSVFARYGLDEQQFKISHSWYQKNSVEQVRRMDSVRVHMERVMEQVELGISRYADTAQVLKQLKD